MQTQVLSNSYPLKDKKIPTYANKKDTELPNLENGETVLNSLDGILSKITGKYHSTGGEYIDVPDGGMIFSSKIKLPKEIVAELLDKPVNKVTKMSPAEISKKFSTKPYQELLDDNNIDKREKDTAQLMKNKNLAKLKATFDAQQEFKKSRGVKEGTLLKDQGLNSDLEKVYSPAGLKSNNVNQSGSLFDKTLINYFSNKQQVGKEYNLSSLPQPQSNINVPSRPSMTNYPEIQSSGERILNGPDMDLKNHVFNTSGLMNVNAVLLPNKTWGPQSNIPEIERIKKEQGWDNQKIFDVIKDYQTKTLGYEGKDSNGKDKFNQSDYFKHNRIQQYNHVMDHKKQLWSTMSMDPIKDSDGNITDVDLQGFVDGYNIDNQIVPSVQSLNPNWHSQPVSTFDYNPIKPNDLNSSVTPVSKYYINSPANPNQFSNPVYESIKLKTEAELANAKLAEQMNLLTGEKAVPFLGNNYQMPTYIRPTINNTLAQERGQNFLNHTYNNSNASSQMTQGINADNYAKSLEGMDQVNLRNYQGVMQTDNQNNDKFGQSYNYNNVAQNRDLGEYVRNVQNVEGKYQENMDRIKSNITNYNLQGAKITDDLSMRNLTDKLTNKEFVPVRNPDGSYTVQRNPYFDRFMANANNSVLFQRSRVDELEDFERRTGMSVEAAARALQRIGYMDAREKTADAKKEEADAAARKKP